MVVKITQGKTVGGMLQYNDKKLKKGEAAILGYNKIITGGRDIEKLRATQIKKSFESLGNLNKTLKNKYIHLSLNPHPEEKLSNETLTAIAKDYMKQLGYASQPYIIYKHTDIERAHLHIVSCNVKANGKKITDSNLFRRSNDIRRDIEKKFGLKEGIAKKNPLEYTNTKKIDYKKGDYNAQIRTKALTVLSLIKFSSFEAYKQHMANYNIAVDICRAGNKAEGKTCLPSGKIIGTTYQITNDKGLRKGLPIKASHIDRSGNLHIEKLDKKFNQHKVDKLKYSTYFERSLQFLFKKSTPALLEKSAETYGIAIIKNENNLDAYLDLKSSHLYEKSELSKPTLDIISQSNISTTLMKEQTKEETSIIEHSVNVASALISILGAGANVQGGDGSTDKDLKRKKRKNRGL